MAASLNQSTSTHSPTPLPAHIRYSQNDVWENWGRTAHCEPQFSFHSKTLDDLVDIVNYALGVGALIFAIGLWIAWKQTARAN